VAIRRHLHQILNLNRRQIKEETVNLVKVKYFLGHTEDLSISEYTYWSLEELKPGDIVNVPARFSTVKAKVTAINIPESEIADFRAKVKTIPAGAAAAPALPESKPEPKPLTGLAGAAAAAGAEIKVVDLFPEIPSPLPGITDSTTAIIKVGPEHDPAVLALAGEAKRLRDYAIARILASDADLKPATDDLAIIAKVRKLLTERKSDYLKPIKAHIDAVNAAFNSIMAPLEDADQITRKQVLAYNAAVGKRRQEAEEINRKKAELAKQEAQFNGTGEITIDTTPVDIPASITNVKTDMGMTSTMKVRKYRVIDFAKLPDQYKIENSALLNKVVKAGIPEIPGVEIFVEETLRVEAR
jgi:hypothetical protein